MKKILFIILSMILFAMSCKKDDIEEPIVPVEPKPAKLEVIVHKHFAYGNNVALSEYAVGLFTINPVTQLAREFVKFIDDTPKKITTIMVLEGQKVLDNIGDSLVVDVSPVFVSSGPSFKIYNDQKIFIGQEGRHEFEFYFAHPPSAGE